MTTYNHFTVLREMDRLAIELGFLVKQSKHHTMDGLFGLFAGVNDDKNYLPVFARDAELYSGTAEELICYMRGWMRSREYLRMIMPKSVTDKRIEHFEDLYRQEIMLQVLKSEKK